jgi:hypothetical protein
LSDGDFEVPAVFRSPTGRFAKKFDAIGAASIGRDDLLAPLPAACPSDHALQSGFMSLVDLRSKKLTISIATSPSLPAL